MVVIYSVNRCKSGLLRVLTKMAKGNKGSVRRRKLRKQQEDGKVRQGH